METKLIFKIGFLILIFGVLSYSIVSDDKTASVSRIETFSFLSNGINTKGKIYLPAAYETNKTLSTIYLIDYSEQHFKLATDEFEKVIDGVKQIEGFEALVVSLENIPDIDTKPETFQEQYEVFKNMTTFISDRYANSNTNTFIGRGSESSIVLMTLFLESPKTSVFDNFIVTDPSPKFTSTMVNILEKSDFPKGKKNKKLHFSFSSSNNREKCTTIINLINKSQFSWLQFESIEYTKSGFENTYPIAYAEGIKYIFNK